MGAIEALQLNRWQAQLLFHKKRPIPRLDSQIHPRSNDNGGSNVLLYPHFLAAAPATPAPSISTSQSTYPSTEFGRLFNYRYLPPPFSLADPSVYTCLPVPITRGSCKVSLTFYISLSLYAPPPPTSELLRRLRISSYLLPTASYFSLSFCGITTFWAAPPTFKL
jgi:hypothetical protein